MGQSISGLIEKLEDKAGKEKMANDAMNSLLELVKMQESAFQLQISNPNFDVKLIPIDQVITKDKTIRCDVTTTVGPILDLISDTFAAFASGEVAKGIATLVSGGIKALVGEYAGNSAMRDYYCIATGDLGGVFRIDLHLYSYRYTSEQLTAISKGVTLVSLVISSVDLSQLKDNTLRVIVQQTFGSSPLEEQQKMYEQLRLAKSNDNRPTLAQMQRESRLMSRKLALGNTQADSDKTGSVSLTFKARFSMGQASQSARELDGYLRGAVSAVLVPTKKLALLSVESVPDDNSTSDSVLRGDVTANFKDLKSVREYNELCKTFSATVKAALDEASDTDFSELGMDSYVMEDPIVN